MNRIISILIIFLFTCTTSWGQTVTSKQAHSMLNSVVIGGRDAINSAKVSILEQLSTPNGIKIKAIECSYPDKKVIDTYVATYNDKGQIIDGMLVAQKGDVFRFRTDTDNEYVWFIPQGEASVTITADSVLVSRIYNQEMKPLGDTYLRHTERITFRYAVQDDGSFIQLKPSVETYEIEGKLSTNPDGSQTELPPTTQKSIDHEFNSLSMNVMTLLYAPVSANVKTMEAWVEMGQFFKQRMNMMGIPDCDLWSANYYKANISNILTQGDGRNMVWLYQHHNEEAPSDMLSIILLGYDSSVPSNAGETIDKLKKTADRLNDKAARKWWRHFTK